MISVRGLSKAFGRGDDVVNAVSDISFDVERGTLTTLLGPSGCGKTTTLRLLAGLERPDGGSIHVEEQCMASPGEHTWIPTYNRPIGMVFQSYAIWPHMSVGENVAFPLRIARPRIGRNEIRERVREVLSLAGIGELLERRATDLSGGQQQRVALARALVAHPKVLLLDEPLSNLDAELRDRMRDEIRSVQQRLGITTVFVTHDQSEALAMSDTVVVMNKGTIIETGLPEEIYKFPRKSFTAQFLGVSNIFEGTVAQTTGDQVVVSTRFGPLTATSKTAPPSGRRVLVALRPSGFDVHRKSQDDDSDWHGTLRFRIYHGESWTYHVDVGDVRDIIVRTTVDKVGIKYGDRLSLQPRPGAAVLLDGTDTDTGIQGVASPPTAAVDTVDSRQPAGPGAS